VRILRLAFVYGDGDPHLTEGLHWFRNWNPSQLIHLVHHVDVAQAVMLAASANDIDGEINNMLSDDKNVFRMELVFIAGFLFLSVQILVNSQCQESVPMTEIGQECVPVADDSIFIGPDFGGNLSDDKNMY
jgi:hypothetical protein